jgi:hypothetical protein
LGERIVSIWPVAVQSDAPSVLEIQEQTLGASSRSEIESALRASRPAHAAG